MLRRIHSSEPVDIAAESLWGNENPEDKDADDQPRDLFGTSDEDEATTPFKDLPDFGPEFDWSEDDSKEVEEQDSKCTDKEVLFQVAAPVL